ncbi:hypothetical protein ABZW30_34035 [Kitasatospora sp. NPDC004669]|uniref:hypothetical protein n=1 Tax=Kitasatospora sp. NPDC004669 TaxID=3154555 RepID=UPI0033B59560
MNRNSSSALDDAAARRWRTARGAGFRFADRTRARHAAVHALLAAGHSKRAVQRQLGMTYRTVKALADVSNPEDLFRGQWQNRPSALDDYKPYLDDRWREGCTNAWKLWEEIVPLGHKGSYQRVSAYLRQKRISPRPVTAQPPSPRTLRRRCRSSRCGRIVSNFAASMACCSLGVPIPHQRTRNPEATG